MRHVVHLSIYLSSHLSIFLTSLMNMSLVLRLPRKMHLCRSSSNVPRLPSFLEMPQNPHVLLTFEELHNPLRLPRETTSEPPKVARTCSVLHILTWKCALRHNGVHFFRHRNFQKWREHVVFCTFWVGNVLRATTPCTFSSSQLPKLLRTPQFLTHFTSKCASRHNAVHFFNISTSKAAPNPSVFNTFYFQMCFAPQCRALFQHLNFQKWSGAEGFGIFSLRNRLRATTACNFSSLISPDVSAPAALASLLFDPPEPQIIGKTQCFATFLPFRASASAFFWFFLFSDLLSSTLSLLSASSLLCFSSVHIVGSLTSKLPSIIYMPWNWGWGFTKVTPLS